MTEALSNQRESLSSLAERHVRGLAALTLRQEQDPNVLAAIDEAVRRNAVLYQRIDAERNRPSPVQQHLAELPQRLAALES